MQHLPFDKSCVGCGHRMPGINNYELRKRCDACGGNTTQYNENNPNPESELGRKLAKEKRNG